MKQLDFLNKKFNWIEFRLDILSRLSSRGPKGPGATCELPRPLHWTSNPTSPRPLASAGGPGEVGFEVQCNVRDSSHVAPGPFGAREDSPERISSRKST